MADYLDEDPVMTSQKYAILSYALTDKRPMIKFRGSFSSIDECKAKIKRLQAIDKYFHMFVIEVGKWGSLLTDEELKKQDVDTEYSNQELNDMMKKYKEQKDKAEDEFEARRRKMVEQAKREGSKEGQEELSKREEHPMSVKQRMEGAEQLLKQLQKDLDEYNKVYTEAKAKWDTYTEEQIKKAEEEVKNLKVE